MIQNVIELDVTKISSEKVELSPSPSAIEKEVSRIISDGFEEEHGEKVNQLGYKRVNFDVAIKRDIIIINKAFAICENGSVEVIGIKHKHRMGGHSISTSLRKRVSNKAMTINLPTPFIIFQNEFISTFKEATLLKITAATLMATILATAGVSAEQLIMGAGAFVLIAILDAILGVMPNTKSDEEYLKDHKIQAKFWKFTANIVAMTALLFVHLFAVNLVPNPNLLQYIPVNIHYLGIGYFISSYVYSIFKYISVANNSKIPIPNEITKHFKK